MLGNKATWDEAFLVGMDLNHRPRGQAVVKEVSVELTISVHGRDRPVVLGEGRIALFEEETDVGILEAAARGSVDAHVVSHLYKSLPERAELI